MATAAQRRGLNGVSSLRRKLRRMETFVPSRIPMAIETSAISITVTAKTLVPVDQGDLKEAIEYKMSGDRMAAAIGPAARASVVAKAVKGTLFATRTIAKKLSTISKKRLFQFFKGYWIEFGTKGNAKKNIPPQPARPFMSPAFYINKSSTVSNVAAAVNEQLKRVSDL